MLTYSSAGPSQQLRNITNMGSQPTQNRNPTPGSRLVATKSGETIIQAIHIHSELIILQARGARAITFRLNLYHSRNHNHKTQVTAGHTLQIPDLPPNSTSPPQRFQVLQVARLNRMRPAHPQVNGKPVLHPANKHNHKTPD